MQRWVTTVVGLAVVALAVWIVVGGLRPAALASRDSGSRVVDGGGGDPDAGASASAAASTDAGTLRGADLVAPEVRLDGGAGSTMPDGTPVPSLPFGVPRQVRFGVVLVSYAGAQPSAGGSRPAARSRGDARILADKLLATAQQDFHAAVQQGDAGSSDDVGRVKPGILEPAPEYVLFTLGVDVVGGPIDTPRGYWIVKRLE